MQVPQTPNRPELDLAIDTQVFRGSGPQANNGNGPFSRCCTWDRSCWGKTSPPRY